MNQHRYDFAQTLIRSAATFVLSHCDDALTIAYKNNNPSDIVTNIDTATETYLIDAIHTAFPDDTFLTEEKTTANIVSQDLWIIDPIDGTMNFAHMGVDYAISLAFYQNGIPVFGLVYDITRDELFHGYAGKTAYLNQTPLHAKTTALSDSIIDISLSSIQIMQQHGYDFSQVEHHTLSQRNLGSAALRICHVALGRVDIYVSAYLKTWDYAAARLILELAGGELALPTLHNFPLNDTPTPVFAANSTALIDELRHCFKR